MRFIKAIFLTASLLLLASCAFAADYWVFVSVDSKAGLTLEDDAQLRKKGEIIHIEPAVSGEIPTQRELQEYAIVTVSDLTKADIEKYTAPLINDTIEEGDRRRIVSHRKHKIDVDSYGLQLGINPVKIDRGTFDSRVELKTVADFERYEYRRLAYVLARPFLRLANVITANAHAAQNISKICAVGSNCTDEHFNSLVTWEDTVDGDLVLDGRQETAEVYDDDGDLEHAKVSIGGSTTDATNYLEITVPSAEQHNGTHLSGAAFNVTSGGDNFEITDEYTRIGPIILKGATDDAIALDAGPNGFTRFERTIIYKPGDRCFSLWIETHYDIRSVVCISPGGHGLWNNSSTGGNQLLSDITFYGSGDTGIVSQNNTICCDNCAVFDSTTVDYGVDDINASCSSKYASSDTSGESGLQSLTAADQFVSLTSGSEDLHLKAGADLISAGETPTVGALTDIDGSSRPVDTYDIGADEYEGGGGPGSSRRIIDLAKWSP